MNANDILALAHAGFNAEQIMQISAAMTAPAPAPAPAPTAVDIAALLGRMDAMTQTLQASNILGSMQPPQPTADEILANIIAPKPPEIKK